MLRLNKVVNIKPYKAAAINIYNNYSLCYPTPPISVDDEISIDTYYISKCSVLCEARIYKEYVAVASEFQQAG